jgi:hypothetical protein
VIANHIALHTPKSGDHCVNLVRDLYTIALVLDHLL